MPEQTSPEPSYQDIMVYCDPEKLHLIETVELMDRCGRLGLRVTSPNSFIVPVDYWSNKVQ